MLEATTVSTNEYEVNTLVGFTSQTIFDATEDGICKSLWIVPAADLLDVGCTLHSTRHLSHLLESLGADRAIVLAVLEGDNASRASGYSTAMLDSIKQLLEAVLTIESLRGVALAVGHRAVFVSS